MKFLATLAFGIWLLQTSVYGEAPSATCTYEGNPTCIDYVGSHWRAHAAQAREVCESEDGTFSPNGACSRQHRLGRCQLSGGNEMEFHLCLYAPITTDQAIETCTSLGGVFLRE